MTLEDSIHSQRLRVLRDAERLGNVSEACRRHGMSRTLFYRLRQRFEQYGPDGVHPKRRQARCGRPPAIPVQTERRVIAFALAWPTCGPQWYSDQLAREGVRIAPTTVWRLLRRRQLGTRTARLAVLEHGSAADDRDPDGAHRQNRAPRRGRGARRAAVVGYVLRRQAERRRQGVANHGLRCRVVVRVGAPGHRRGHRGRGVGLPARRSCVPAIARPAGGCAACSRTTGRNSRAPLPRAVSASGSA